MLRTVRKEWNINIEETQKWLHEEAANGHILEDMNCARGIFYFKEAKPEQLYYYIDMRNPKDTANIDLIKSMGYVETIKAGIYRLHTCEKECTNMPEHTGMRRQFINSRKSWGVVMIVSGIIAVINATLTVALIILFVLASTDDLAVELFIFGIFFVWPVMLMLTGIVLMIVGGVSRKKLWNKIKGNNFIN